MNKKLNNLDIKMGRIARRVKIVLTIAILCFGIGVVTAIPQQDYTLYGTPTLNGKVLTAQDDAVVSLKVDSIELVSYMMGDISGTDNYVLKVPMDSNSGVTTAAQEGDTALIYINGIAINEGPQIIGAPGTTAQFDISATSAENPPSVTVRYPNGGEAISIGTQVQVSAHATDDNAVTGVTIYYSRDGGSNWDLIGEGVKVSGTDKDGTWNRTWNTDGLSAGTNYMIKAVASDGAFTSEDRSDSKFSLLSSKVIRVPMDYPTIQAAIDAASSGYIINVSSGTYFEHLVIDKPLKLIGEDKNTTIINGSIITGSIITGSGSGCCVNITADNVEISGFTIKKGVRGVCLESSNGSIIDNNIISDHCVGISLSDSNNNLITQNSLYNNGCYISGIQLYSSHNNVIRDNDLVENGGGVSLYDSNNNLIYHNNFVDNTKRQAFDDKGTNSWDKGPVEGGNYWSDHDCVGNPSAEPYSIDSDGVDHYPFQDQNGWLKGHQLGLTGFDGLWLNIDENTGGITKIEIKKIDSIHLSIHPWGKCHPTDCDWGARTFEVDINLFTITWTTSFCTRNMTFTLQENDRLHVHGFTHFTDNRGRSDYHWDGYFYRASGKTKG